MFEDKNFLEILEERFPNFAQDSFQPMRGYYYDEQDKLIEYGVIPDFADYLVFQLREGNSEEFDRVQEFLVELLDMGDSRVTTLVIVGFMEHFSPSSDYYADLKSSFNERLRDSLLEVEDWWSGKTWTKKKNAESDGN